MIFTADARFLTHFMAEMPDILAENSKNNSFLRGASKEIAREKAAPYYVARLRRGRLANPYHFAVADGHRGSVKAPPCRALTSRKNTRERLTRHTTSSEGSRAILSGGNAP